jgi:rhodanese-related sulfurtransferase
MKLSMDELFQIFSKGLQPDEIILDVRDADDFSEGHVPGSFSVPHDQILNQTEAFKEKLKYYNRVYIHCGGGGKAGRVYEALESAGLNNIVHICDSGMRSWIAAGYPVSSGK